MKDAPRNLRELVAYLARNPRVECASDNPRVAGQGPLYFLWVMGGGIWWSRSPGDDHTSDRVFTPIDCGMTPAETAVDFEDAGFIITKFGITIMFTYLPEEASR